MSTTGEIVVVKEKSQSKLRWMILVCACIMMIGNYYCYDIPAALHTQMYDYFGKPGDFESYFALLYTVYSVPNIILPFFGGFFVDKFGVRICLVVFILLITAGQVITAFGLSIKSWPVMLIGRVVFGFGGESLAVANSAVLAQWFKGKELAFAFGLNLSVARLGSVINNVVSPALAAGTNIQFALWFGVFLCLASVGSVLAINTIDASVEAMLEGKGAHGLLINNEDDDEVVVDLHPDLTNSLTGSASDVPRRSVSKDRNVITHGTYADDEDELDRDHPPRERIMSKEEALVEPSEAKFSDVFRFKQIFWVMAIICVVIYGCVLPFNNIASALLLERDYFKVPPNKCHLQDDYACQGDGNDPVDCPASKWYQPPLPLGVDVDGKNYSPLTEDDIDCTDDTWKDGCAKEFCKRQKDAQAQAGTIMSIPYIISACLSPFAGGFVDRFAGRAILATLAAAALIVVHLMMGYTTVDPVGPLVGQGLAYTGFAAVLWPAIAMVVPERFVGLAYGVVTAIQNGGLAAFPLVVALIYSKSGDEYIPEVELFFAILAMIGFVIGLYMNFYDFFFLNSKLNIPGRHRPEEDEDDVNDRVIRNSASEYDKARLRRSFDEVEKRKEFNSVQEDSIGRGSNLSAENLFSDALYK